MREIHLFSKATFQNFFQHPFILLCVWNHGGKMSPTFLWSEEWSSFPVGFSHDALAFRLFISYNISYCFCRNKVQKRIQVFPRISLCALTLRGVPCTHNPLRVWIFPYLHTHLLEVHNALGLSLVVGGGGGGTGGRWGYGRRRRESEMHRNDGCLLMYYGFK